MFFLTKKSFTYRIYQFDLLISRKAIESEKFCLKNIFEACLFYIFLKLMNSKEDDSQLFVESFTV